MNSKQKMVLTLILSIAASCLFVFAFAIDYIKNFTSMYNLLLFGSVLLTITAWSCFYVSYVGYKGQNSTEKTRKGTGNRSNRRKK